MVNTLVIDYSRCHGCGECELACATISKMNKGSSRPRIMSFIWDVEGWGIPIACQHCQDAPCRAVCPTGAIYRDEEFNRVMVNYKRCIGCRMCMAVCPFGAMDFDREVNRVIKCDLCDGDPLCVKLCSYEALQYIDVKEQSIPKKTEVAEKIREILLGRKTGSKAGLIQE